MRVTLDLAVQSAVDPSENVLQVASMFGLGIDRERVIQLIPHTDLDLASNQIIFVTGASGSGKSTILRLIREQADRDDAVHAIDLNNLPGIEDRPLVDVFPHRPLEQVLRLLSLAGLNDAFVMLRRPSQLSDGQRYRLRLAQAMAMIEENVCPQRQKLILADEFCATLDRDTAKVIARQVRKWVAKTSVCFIAATTHDDLLEAIEPDILIEKNLGESMDVLARSA